MELGQGLGRELLTIRLEYNVLWVSVRKWKSSQSVSTQALKLWREDLRPSLLCPARIGPLS